jgi:hypothetical protein
MGNQQVIQAKRVEANRQRNSAIAPKPPFTTRPGIHPLVQLQRQIGNQAVNRLIQAKLKVGKPNDVYEQEADRVADTVMRMPDPLIQRQEEEKTEETAQAKPLVGTISPLVQRQADEKEETAQAKSLIEPITPLVQRQPQEEKKDETAQMLQRQAADENKDETAQAKGTADATPEVAPNLESRIQTMRGGGQPLADSTRTFFESRFGYDFGGVRVHTDSQAAETASHLNAQAFTIGRNIFFSAGRYEPHTTSGQWLLAHELTHTVQQSPQPLTATSRVVQSHPDPGAQSSQFLQRQAPEEEKPETIQTKAEGAIAQRAAPKAIALSTSGNQVGVITQPQSVTVSPAPTQVQGIFDIELPGIDTVLNWAAERAANIPGFTLVTVILGRNPVNNQPVARNAVNLIRGVMGLVPGGELLFQGLQASGAIDRVATWLEQQIDQLNITWEGIVALFTRALNSLSASDIFDIRGAGERVLNIFRPTLDRVRALAASVGSRVIQFIKEAILRPVGQFAQRLPFYPLLTVILGKDPITDQMVDRSPTNVIRGILLIIPGGEEKFQQLQQSGVIDRAFAWFNEQLTRLNLTWNNIKALFARAWDVLGIQDLLSPSAAFNKIQTIFGEPVQRITTFAGAAIRKVTEFIFEGVLTLAGGLGRQVLNIFNRARGVINNIIENPIGFIGNLVGAVKRGFQQFSSNILTHLQAGLVGWLFGALAGAGLQLPERFDLRGIVSLVMQVLGLTYQHLRGILVRLLGSEERVQRAEQVFDFLVTLVRDGIAAAWERIVEFAGNLQEMVLGGIRDWVARTVVGQAIARLVTLFNPAGAVIQAIMAIYNTVVFFIERAQQIGALVEAVFESIVSIAAGNIGAAANYVERTMARTIPVILGFLARFIDLGNVSEQIQNVVRRIQAPIENAMNRVADWIATQVRRLGSAIMGTGRSTGTPDTRQPDEQMAALRAATTEASQIVQSERDPVEQRRALDAIKQRHRITTLEVVTDTRNDSGRQVHIHAAVNPTWDGEGFLISEMPPGPAVVIVMNMADPPGRAGFERVLQGPTAVGLPASWVRAHLVGQGFGQESPHGIFYAPGTLNGNIQNAGIELAIRGLYEHRVLPNTEFQLTASAEPHSTLPAPRLAHVGYHLIARNPGGSWLDLLEADVWVADAVPNPNIRGRIGEVNIPNIYQVSNYENPRLGIERP